MYLVKESWSNTLQETITYPTKREHRLESGIWDSSQGGINFGKWYLKTELDRLGVFLFPKQFFLVFFQEMLHLLYTNSFFWIKNNHNSHNNSLPFGDSFSRHTVFRDLKPVAWLKIMASDRCGVGLDIRELWPQRIGRRLVPFFARPFGTWNLGLNRDYKSPILCTVGYEQHWTTYDK